MFFFINSTTSQEKFSFCALRARLRVLPCTLCAWGRVSSWLGRVSTVIVLSRAATTSPAVRLPMSACRCVGPVA